VANALDGQDKNNVTSDLILFSNVNPIRWQPHRRAEIFP